MYPSDGWFTRWCGHLRTLLSDQLHPVLLSNQLQINELLERRAQKASHLLSAGRTGQAGKVAHEADLGRPT